MKKTSLLVIAFAIFSWLNAFSQTEYLPYTPENKEDNSLSIYRNIEFTAGYIPKSDHNALKGSISVNNLLFKRMGFYTSVEKEINSDKFSNTIGITGTLHKYFYLWGGMDLFTNNGFLQTKSFSGPRKEIGIGITPYKTTVLRLGWSSSVGISISVGVGIPF